jgi:hypothetical protein
VTAEQTVGFSDELRLGLIGQTRRVWAPVGVKIVQPLQYERQWCYILIVVDGRTGRLWWSWTLGMGAADLRPEVAKWHGAGIDAVVWDRAPAHQTLSGQPQDVVLILQPPHSPELNPAERVIEAIRQRIEGLVYASLPEKYAAVDAFLQELDADPARVRSLAGWQWIQDNLDRLPTPYDIAA